MCGVPIHCVYRDDEDSPTYCYISTLCDSWGCNEQPELCPHQGVGDCTCNYEDDEDD